MQNFQNFLVTLKRSFISAFSVHMTVPLSNLRLVGKYVKNKLE